MNAPLTVFFAGAALLVAGCGGTTPGRAATPSAAAPAAGGNPGQSVLPGSEGDSGAASTAQARSAGLKPGFDPTSPYYHRNMAAPVPLLKEARWLLYDGPGSNAPAAQLIDETTKTEGGVRITTRRELITEWVQLPWGLPFQSSPGMKELSLTVAMPWSEDGPWHLRGHSDPGSKLLPLQGSGHLLASSPRRSRPVEYPFTFTIPDNEHDYLLVPVIRRRFVRTTVVRAHSGGNIGSAAAAVASTSRIEQLHTVRPWFWQMQYTDSVYHGVSSQVFRRERSSRRRPGAPPPPGK